MNKINILLTSVGRRSYLVKYFKEALQYMDREGFYTYYGDYLNFAKQLGYPLNEKKYLFPNKLKKAHDEAFKKIQILESEKVNKGIIN